MKRYLLVIAGLLTFSSIVSAQEEETKLISPDGTYMFEKRDDGELFLDVYRPVLHGSGVISWHLRRALKI